MGLEFSVIYSICEFGCLRMSEELVCLSYNTVVLSCHIVCVLMSWVFWVTSYSSRYVSLTYVCPLGDVILCSIRTFLQNGVCSWVSTNGYTHLSCCFLIWAISSIPDSKPSLVLLLYTYFFMTLTEYWLFCIHTLAVTLWPFWSKRGRSFWEAALEGEYQFKGEQSKTMFILFTLFMCMVIVLCFG